MEGLRGGGPLAWVEQWLPELYLVVAGLIVGLLCFVTPPFFTPDEPHQAARAISLTHGVLRTWMGSREFGAEIDENALGVMDQVDQVRMNWERGAGFFLDRHWGPLAGARARAQMQGQADIRWDGRRTFAPFPNTAVYPPFFYLPAMLGWRVGEAAGWTIFASLRLARLLTGLCAVLLGWGALRLWAGPRWILLAYLLLPSALFLEASCAQDACLLGVAGLMAAMLSRPLAARRELTLGELWGLAAALAVAATARAPYLAMAPVLFLPGVAAERSGSRRWVGPVIAAGLVAGVWSAWQGIVRPVGLDTADRADPELQAQFLREHMLRAAWAVARGTAEAGIDFVRRGLYVVGWNDLLAPRWMAVMVGVCIAAVIAAGRGSPMRGWRGKGLLALCVAAPLLGVSLAEYVIWTPPGFYTVYGVQPRYWLPVMPLALLMVSGRRRGGWLGAVGGAGLAVTACTLPWVVARVFYGEGLWR